MMICRHSLRFLTAVLLAGMVTAAASCGLDEKINELVNPPVPKTVPDAAITVESETVNIGKTVLLDGSPSSDPQGKTLTYAWTLEVPNGSAAALTSATTATTSFTPDKGGTYLASLTVTNSSSVSSGTVTVRIDVVGTGGNHPPVAITTTAVTASTGNVVALDGSASYDADQQGLRYTWTLLGAPATSAVAELQSSSSSVSYLTPDVAGTYSVKFTVSDGTDSDQAIVTITASDTAPTASFTADNTSVMVNTPVILNASASSDPQGLALTYAWSLEAPTGSSAALSSATSVVTSFTPDKGGYYVVYLVVTNSSGVSSETATATISAVGTGSNHPPVAVTTSAVTGSVGNVVVLDGSSSYDPDQQTLTHAWTLIGVPSTSAVTSLQNSTSSVAYLTPDVAGEYSVKLAVSDGTDTDVAFVTVTVSSATALSAFFTADNTTVKLNTPVTLNASGSYDPQGLALTYAWTLTAPAGSSAALSSASTVITTFTPDKGGYYIVTLTVTNTLGQSSSPATKTIDATWTGSNHPPVAITSATQTGFTGTAVVLDGSASYDADQTTITYSWTFVSVPSASVLTVLTDSSSKTATFTPDSAGTYIIKFTVSDGTDSDVVYVTVSVI